MPAPDRQRHHTMHYGTDPAFTQFVGYTLDNHHGPVPHSWRRHYFSHATSLRHLGVLDPVKGGILGSYCLLELDSGKQPSDIFDWCRAIKRGVRTVDIVVLIPGR